MIKKSEKGFTLIELMIVVAIVGILAAVAIPKFADLIDKAKEAKVKGNLSSIRGAVSIYYGSFEGLAPSNAANGAGLTLGAALCTDGDNMSKLPGAEIPSLSGAGKTAGGSWADDAASNYLAYASKGTTTDLDGWNYDYGELEIWVEEALTDTAGNGIHDW
ncbi:type IV pilin protein [Elusimicrobiota bacterium]